MHSTTHKFLWRFMRPYRWAYLVVIVLAVTATALALAEPYILKSIFDKLQQNFTQAGGSEVISGIGLLVIGWAVVALLKRGAEELKDYLAASSTSMADKHMLARSFYEIMDLPIRFHRSKKSGNLMDRLCRAQSNMYRILEAAFAIIVPAILTMSAVLIIMFKENWILALLALSTAPITIFTTLKLYPKISHTQKVLNKMYEKYYGDAYDAISAIEVVKSFTSEKVEYQSFLTHAKRAQRLENEQNRRWKIIRFTQNASANVAQVLVIWYGAVLAFQGLFSIGDVILFVSLASMLFKPLDELSYVYDSFHRGVHSIRKVIKYLETPTEIHEKADAIRKGKIRGEIEFRNVTFSYDHGRPILKNINCKIEPGKVIALVGPSGVGKTTLARLLCRFYDVTSGEIRIDGRSLTDYGLEYLRRNVGIVLQENILFNDTLLHNLTYGSKQVSRRQVIAAAKAANAHEFIRSLDKGYNTVVGERGVRLSGGEKQRIAIARAFIKNPPVLILDEATSALDSESEKKVQEAIWHLIEGRTTFIIAHRLSTIMRADEIFVFEKGQILERGTHSQLLEKEGGMYKKLFELQSGGYLSEKIPPQHQKIKKNSKIPYPKDKPRTHQGIIKTGKKQHAAKVETAKN